MLRDTAGEFINIFGRETLRLQEIQQINKAGALATDPFQRGFRFSVNSIDGIFIHILLWLLQRLVAHSQLRFLKTQVNFAALFERAVDGRPYYSGNDLNGPDPRSQTAPSFHHW